MKILMESAPERPKKYMPYYFNMFFRKKIRKSVKKKQAMCGTQLSKHFSLKL